MPHISAAVWNKSSNDPNDFTCMRLNGVLVALFILLYQMAFCLKP
ncbi:hypothetical protein CGLO_12717 [Colletotrichum gloeosporioides Cg-14]|uniref:Uncharacterized protein n=1 Tax=Colletotrichum gloeosporioides (strain Cg-14) TaxID=1237896 RepID=T0K7U8_COLGC|nr:hypothetical protein CGLO_12717 [Colletotrichum gloeosporioides Cg-14]